MRVRAVSVSLVLVGFVIGAAAILLAEPGNNGSSANAAAVAADHSSAGSPTGGTPCEQSGPPASKGQNEHGRRGPSPWTTPDAATRDQLVAQLAVAHQVTIDYPTVAQAEAAGYKMTTTYVPCIGAHYINAAYLGQFDVAHPAMLLYNGTASDSKIVGLSYSSLSGKAPPEGFAGTNDAWHQHNLNGGLCIKDAVVVGAESTSKADCEARGGAKIALGSLWMMHAWVADGWPSSWGVFSSEHPDLGGRIGQIAAAQDPNAAANPGD
jgi:hypothetical protein